MFQPTPKHNSWHNQISPAYIEWWYLDAQLVPGGHLSGSIALWGNLQRPGSCVVRSDFAISLPDGQVVDFSKQTHLKDFRASTDFCDIQLGPDTFKEIENHYFLHLEQENLAFLDLELVPECSGFGYQYFFDNDPEKYFSWIVPVPKGTVKGFLTLHEKVIPIDGVGYHDHNWASISLSENIQEWQWGRYFGKDIALIFAVVEGYEKTLFRGMAVLEKQDVAFYYRYLFFGFPEPDISIQETALGWDLSANNTNLHLTLDIHKMHLLREREESRGYRRIFSEVQGKLSDDYSEVCLTGSMIHEFKKLQSKEKR